MARLAAVVPPELDRWCADHLGAGATEVRWHRPGTAIVWCVALSDGRTAVVKAHTVAPRHVAAAIEVQRRLPWPWVPRPLADPAPLGDRLAVAEEHLPGGSGCHDAVRSAATLLDLVGVARGEHADGLEPLWCVRPLVDGLWPPPHDARFDLAAAGGEWIDDLAAGPRALLAAHGDVAPRIVGHADWRAEHVRVGDGAGALVAVHDWVSLALGTVEAFVGHAAAQWTVDFEAGVGWPDVGRSRRFVDAVAVATRDVGLDMDAVDAARRYALAYTARCAHSAGVHPDFVASLYERWEMGT